LELEALEAIFLEDYTLLSENPRLVQLRLLPFPNDDDEENHVGVLMSFTLQPDYPDVAPKIELESLMGLTENQCLELLDNIVALANESLGMPMIFTLAESLKEWLDANNSDHTDESMHAQMVARMDAEKKEKKDAENAKLEKSMVESSQEERRKRLDGTPVTTESYNIWLAGFIKEVNERKIQEKEIQTKGSKVINVAPDAHLTGRQCFEDGALLVGSELNEWDGDIQEELFLEEEEVEDLSDLDSSSSE